MTKSTVYVVQAPRNAGHVDFSSAADFGKVKFILRDNAMALSSPHETLEEIRRQLENFGPDDYITSISGDPAASFMAGLCLPESYDGPIQWLRWERIRDENGNRTTKGFYVPATIDLGYDQLD